MEEEIYSESNSFLTFNIGKELFAASVTKVLNILELTPITYVPMSPNYMKGVTNLRGIVLPVIDTRIKIGMPPIVYTENTCILVLNFLDYDERITVGALVDSVQEVIEVADNEILEPPTVGTKFRAEYITGIIKNNDTFIMVLDIERIFSPEDTSLLSNKVFDEAVKKDKELNEKANQNQNFQSSVIKNNSAQNNSTARILNDINRLKNKK
jgi:purine-binding chemotaxis protein CheW